ncbi:AMP-binding protein [Streptomyces violaceorubidus]|uniref:AMP-binding protein n=1 Tax=Streptomyces violaceorubidus TaxID=284042 RepID=UPI000A45C2E2|nr:AMP-binding protein [Streptomyces violaceorubidus]
MKSRKPAELPATLYDLVADTARRCPGAIALETPADPPMTYRELIGAAELLGRFIAAAVDGEVPDRIGLLASKSARTYAAYLAVLGLGATVVPLSASAPPKRVQSVARAAGLDLILTAGGRAADVLTNGSRGAAEGLRAAAGPRLLPIPDPRDLAKLPPAPRRPVQDTAYILFTSGSTGKPKGVPVSHANALSFVTHNLKRYGTGLGDRMTQNFDLAFDVSVFDLFVAWGSGAALVAPGPQDLLHPVRWVNRRAITHWTSVPSAISNALGLRELPSDSMPTLRFSIFLGEQLTVEQAEAWRRAAPRGVLENAYGPTEMTVFVSSYRLPDRVTNWPTTANRTIPVGRVYDHLEAVVVADGREADEGELCVRGPQRFDGYLDPRDNAGRFLTLRQGRFGPAGGPLPGPADWYRTGDLVSRDQDGTLTHLGRLDAQVKIRGHRVELAEIEGALRLQPDVADAVVLALPGHFGSQDLVAFYTSVPGHGTDSRALRTHLARTLPAYMIPRRFTLLDSLPLTSNGKVDRMALRDA